MIEPPKPELLIAIRYYGESRIIDKVWEAPQVQYAINRAYPGAVVSLED